MEYKLLYFHTESNSKLIKAYTRFDMSENPLIEKELNSYAADGWRPVNLSCSNNNCLFILLERERDGYNDSIGRRAR